MLLMGANIQSLFCTKCDLKISVYKYNMKICCRGRKILKKLHHGEDMHFILESWSFVTHFYTDSGCDHFHGMHLKKLSLSMKRRNSKQKNFHFSYRCSMHRPDHSYHILYNSGCWSFSTSTLTQWLQQDVGLVAVAGLLSCCQAVKRVRRLRPKLRKRFHIRENIFEPVWIIDPVHGLGCKHKHSEGGKQHNI